MAKCQYLSEKGQGLKCSAELDSACPKYRHKRMLSAFCWSYAVRQGQMQASQEQQPQSTAYCPKCGALIALIEFRKE